MLKGGKTLNRSAKSRSESDPHARPAPRMIYLLLNTLENWLLEHNLYRYVSVFAQIQFRALLAACLSFAFVLLLGRRVIARLVKLKIGDSGLSDAEALRRHTQSKANTPTMGGVLIAAAILISVLLLSDLTKFYIQIGLIVVVWLAALARPTTGSSSPPAGAKDSGSRQGLYSWEKLVFQLGLGVLVGYFVYSHGVRPADRASPTCSRSRSRKPTQPPPLRPRRVSSTSRPSRSSCSAPWSSLA